MSSRLAPNISEALHRWKFCSRRNLFVDLRPLWNCIAAELGDVLRSTFVASGTKPPLYQQWISELLRRRGQWVASVTGTETQYVLQTLILKPFRQERGENDP